MTNQPTSQRPTNQRHHLLQYVPLTTVTEANKNIINAENNRAKSIINQQHRVQSTD